MLAENTEAKATLNAIGWCVSTLEARLLVSGRVGFRVRLELELTEPRTPTAEA
jgi:hypothetical protein